MSQTDPTLTAMHRKAGVVLNPLDTDGVTPAKALRLSVARAADRLLDLRAIVLAVQETRVPLTELIENIEENWLILLLEGPASAQGVLLMDPQFLGALIEMQTMGEVTTTPATARGPTPTDGSMTEAFVDRFLSEFEGPLLGTPSEKWANGFRFGLMMDTPQALSLVIPEDMYRALEVQVDIASGAKRGTLRLYFPAEGPSEKNTQKSGGQKDWNARFKSVVLETSSEMEAVLCRLRLPLSQISEFAVGHEVALKKTTLNSVTLEIAGDTTIAHARLGQTNGYRALRILSASQRDEDTPRSTNISSGVSAPETDLADLPDLPPLGNKEVETNDMDMAPMPDLPDLPDLSDLPDLEPP